ncbi:uncharacterized protein FIBRA_05198 [Fibroporia radiculosa]|uniref:Uncharacterized protein n=1 Tax=Fibroporia radiculosa TaxID=599839 RepID=J4G8S5_9APHY|nr:uncharacterized protein FIBRA_05198 [Fibroporia radiculosa]CCM03078.1 predicted protein [Fibroporia radiculosa]
MTITSPPNKSPASTRSIYFDAPLMHLFSKRKSSTIAAPTDGADPSEMPPPFQDPNQPSDLPEANVDPQPLTTSAPEHTFTEKQHGTMGAERNTGVTPSINTNGDASYPPPESQPPKELAMTASPLSDSGYGSPSTANHPPKRSASTDMKPIPILWSKRNAGPNGTAPPNEEEENQDATAATGESKKEKTKEREHDGIPQRSTSLRSTRSARDRDSLRSTPLSRTSTRRRRVSLSSGTFAAGAGTVGPAATTHPDDTSGFNQRSRTAEADLTAKQRARVEKASGMDAKRVAKVIRSEGQAELLALEEAIRELADIQKMQKGAIREESRAVSAHAKAIRTFHREELDFLAARAKFDRAQTELQAFEDSREAARNHATEITDMLQEKNQEVEWLRQQKAADDREREAKLKELTGSV